MTSFEQYVLTTDSYREGNLRLKVYSPRGPFSLFDKVVYNFLIHILIQKNKLQSPVITISLDDLAKNIFYLKNTFPKSYHEDIMLSFLKLKFCLVLAEADDENNLDYFSILSDITLNQETQLMMITFNIIFINRMVKKISYFHKIDFYGYRTLTNETTTLYDVLIRKHDPSNVWHFPVADLAPFYPASYPINALIDEINLKTTLQITYAPNALHLICTISG